MTDPCRSYRYGGVSCWAAPQITPRRTTPPASVGYPADRPGHLARVYGPPASAACRTTLATGPSLTSVWVGDLAVGQQVLQPSRGEAVPGWTAWHLVVTIDRVMRAPISKFGHIRWMAPRGAPAGPGSGFADSRSASRSLGCPRPSGPS